MSGHTILIIVDDLRIGGIERIALDQAFGLSDMQIPVTLCYRQNISTLNNPNFLDLESKRISDKNIKITSLPETNWSQFKFLIKLIKENEFTVVINHSIGATVIIRFARMLKRKRFKIKTFIHQLPVLSAPAQRFKRFTYILASDEIYAYSKAVVADWNQRLNNNYFFKITHGWKRPTLLRNGIYLDRLPKLSEKKTKQQTRIVFIARDTAWKNREFFIKILRENSDLTALLVLPKISENDHRKLTNEFGDRIKVEVGKKTEDIEFYASDIQVYNFDYGEGVRFIESISLSCLELACLGIPSLVANSGADTWPELIEMNIFFEVNWANKDAFRIAKAKTILIDDKSIKYRKIRSLISIGNNLNEILNL